MLCPPGPDCDASSLTSGDIAVDSPAKDNVVPSCLAEVMHTVVEEDGGADGRIACTEWAVQCLQYATLAAVHVTGLPALEARSTHKSTAVLSAGCWWFVHNPAGHKGEDAHCSVPSGRREVVQTLVIVVAAQATDLSLKGLRHRDDEMVEMVEGDLQAIPCLQYEVVAVVIHTHPTANQAERHRADNTVYLHWWRVSKSQVRRQFNMAVSFQIYPSQSLMKLHFVDPSFICLCSFHTLVTSPLSLITHSSHLYPFSFFKKLRVTNIDGIILFVSLQ